MKPQFLIAAPHSGSGKTTVARGLMALLTEKGYRVQPYKCGPDYIDTKFHTAVCQRPSINLDSFMADAQHIRHLYRHYSQEADICIVEGMMGLFDGYDRDKGSSAEIAQTLNIPVILVVDARSAAYSTAALLQGFLHFRNGLQFAGIIFNKVGSTRHAEMLRQVCDDLHIRCLGCIPKQYVLQQGSRYLGLDFTKESDMESLRALMDQHIDWQTLLQQTSQEQTTNALPVHAPRGTASLSNHRLVVARNDEAFSFLYQENLDRYEQVVFFDPERDVPQLKATDILYLPGGYPEKHLKALRQNDVCRQVIKSFAEQGGRVIAECGGMMYLCEKIIADDGIYPMCGVLPYSISARQEHRKLSLGYRQFVLDNKEYRGHEFHYTQFLDATLPSVVQVYDAKGDPVTTPVFRYKNVLASYTHLYQI
jgi:cobyrinic acid a,c-diamide synthase